MDESKQTKSLMDKLIDLLGEYRGSANYRKAYLYKDQRTLRYIADIAEGKMDASELKERTLKDDEAAAISYSVFTRIDNRDRPGTTSNKNRKPIIALYPDLLEFTAFKPGFFPLITKKLSHKEGNNLIKYLFATRNYYKKYHKRECYEIGALSFALRKLAEINNLSPEETEIQLNRYVYDNPLYRDIIKQSDNIEWVKSLETKLKDDLLPNGVDWMAISSFTRDQCFSEE